MEYYSAVKKINYPHNNTEQSQQHCVEQRKPNVKYYTQYNSICVMFKNAKLLSNERNQNNS